MKNNLEKIIKLTNEIKKLEEELKVEKNLVLENFRNMSIEDLALCDNKIIEKNIAIQYFPMSTNNTVDTAKMKEDGIYEKYLKTSIKSDYIKIMIKGE